jgi:hypothetical protein
MITFDRIQIAECLAYGAKVLDIGGQKMANCNPDSPFAMRYADIEKASSEYRIADYQNKPAVDYVINFNEPDSIPAIRKALDEYQPDVILCMETLEHINYHYELMNEMARAISLYSSKVFITLPNNANWIFNILGWNSDHSVAFFRDVAYRFITRSELGKHTVLVGRCMQKYLWYWQIVYALSMFQPFSWGFLILPKGYKPSQKMEHIVKLLSQYTCTHFLAVSH